MSNTFTQYHLSPEIQSALKVLNYKEPTEIQSLVLPLALEGRDIAAGSQTGSGKTAAFGIPICEMADWGKNSPQALVLEPTRELTLQVKEELFAIGRNKRLKVPDLFGGFPIEKQILTLKQKSHIVVGTPGRLLDHISRGTIELSDIRIVVIDEADLMLDMGFIADVEKILEAVPDCQLMLFSATLGDSLQSLMDQYMTDPVTVTIQSEIPTVKEIEQSFIRTDNDSKYEAFLNVLRKENPDTAIIFCGTREMANVLCRKLGRDNVKCGVLHGDIDQQDRIRTIEGFRRGSFRYLIATEVAARGIDFPNLSLVVNYDFPTGREPYIHRIGRTGRNGESGKAVSFVTDTDESMKKMVEEYMNYTIPEAKDMVPSEQEKAAFQEKQQEKAKGREKKGAGFHREITRLTISGGRKSKMRAVDIVGTICSIEGVSPEDIGVIDIRDSITYVDIMNGQGKRVCDALQEKTMKGKVRKVRVSRLPG